MAASSNDSQGLKIAVALFVSLTVILAVTCYFLYSNYDQAAQQLVQAQSKAQQAQKAADDALRQYDEMKKQIGSKPEEYEAVKAEIAAETKKIQAEIAAIGPQVQEMVGKVQAAGGSNPTLEEVKSTAQNLATTYMTEPNPNFISSLARVKDMLKNQTRLAAVLATNYTELKRSLESANSVNKQQLDVVEKDRDTARADVESEQTKHVAARADLHQKIDTYQTDINNKATEIATLTNQLRQTKEETTKKIGDLNNVIRELQEFKAKSETVLDRPDGHVTYVDYGRGEVRTNLTYRMGARPQMHLTIFDSSSPGIPTDKPKGTIELTYVSDKYSMARIVETKSPIDPIRNGDIVYSPAWSPNEPMRFALIGKMDVNRDGVDDRADLIRLIESAGGIVDYDLPPPYAGKERGKITPRDAWYVLDERSPLREYENRAEDLGTAENKEFLEKRSAAVREARESGVRPIPIERLLSYLGYNFHAPIRGRAEAIDKNTLRGLLRPQPQEKKAATGSENEAPKEEAMPKEEEK